MKKSKAPYPKKDKHKAHGKTDTGERGLNTIAALIITEKTEDGELLAEPVKWEQRHKPPIIVITESGRSTAVTVGDRVLAKLRKIRPQLYQALVIRALPNETPQPVLGVFVATADGGIIEPVNRRVKESFMVASADTHGAAQGDLVSGVTLPGMPSLSMSYAKITEVLGKLDSPKAASLIASHMHGLPSAFSKEALQEAEDAPPPVMERGREDLREIPLVTIDGADARDFDDAVYAKRDGDSWHIIVAIADVAHYVKEGSALDATAFERGNSVYFPDRVLPMLPERLSNGLCSLKPEEDRYCLAAHIWVDDEGKMLRYHFVRALMRSAARFTYEQVAEIEGGNHAHPLYEPIIKPLFAAYKALAYERDTRGALDLDLPEYKISFDEAGNVAAILPRARLESHRLIEAYMITANVAAADWLLKKKIPAIYRVHESPSEEKLEDLYQLLKMTGYSLSKGSGVTASQFNRILKKSAGQPDAYLVHNSVLRSQMQAYYAAENLGHFGLNLTKYAHFTSPIRRYSDLVVHRGLMQAISGEHEGKKKAKGLAEVALHISDTERKAMMAERDASDRYKVAYMSRKLGANFAGTITGMNEYGLFVSLNENGITGFVPIRNLKGDFYVYDKQHRRFQGRHNRKSFTLGDELVVEVQEANGMTGSLIFMPQGASEDAPKLRHAPKSHKGKNKHKQRENKDKGKKKKRR